MQDYHIYAHFSKGGKASPTSVRSQNANQTSKTQAVDSEEREAQTSKMDSRKSLFTATQMKATAFATAHKINAYVGEITENRTAQRRMSVGLTFAGIGIMAATNPGLAMISAGMFVGNAALNYSVRTFKENLSADYMRQLSNGTVKVGR